MLVIAFLAGLTVLLILLFRFVSARSLTPGGASGAFAGGLIGLTVGLLPLALTACFGWSIEPLYALGLIAFCVSIVAATGYAVWPRS